MIIFSNLLAILLGILIQSEDQSNHNEPAKFERRDHYVFLYVKAKLLTNFIPQKIVHLSNPSQKIIGLGFLYEIVQAQDQSMALIYIHERLVGELLNTSYVHILPYMNEISLKTNKKSRRTYEVFID